MTARVFGIFAVVAALASVAPQPASGGPLIFDAEEITGEVPRPQVTVFISRQNLNDPYELELKESFLPKIVEAVEHAPF